MAAAASAQLKMTRETEQAKGVSRRKAEISKGRIMRQSYNGENEEIGIRKSIELGEKWRRHQ
jgi:hypothetical protein